MTPEEVKEKRKHIKHALKNFFQSPVGQDAVELLEYEFDVESIKQADPYETYYRLGLHDALTVFKNLAK